MDASVLFLASSLALAVTALGLGALAVAPGSPLRGLVPRGTTAAAALVVFAGALTAGIGPAAGGFSSALRIAGGVSLGAAALACAGLSCRRSLGAAALLLGLAAAIGASVPPGAPGAPPHDATLLAGLLMLAAAAVLGFAAWQAVRPAFAFRETASAAAVGLTAVVLGAAAVAGVAGAPGPEPAETIRFVERPVYIAVPGPTVTAVPIAAPAPPGTSLPAPGDGTPEAPPETPPPSPAPDPAPSEPAAPTSPALPPGPAPSPLIDVPETVSGAAGTLGSIAGTTVEAGTRTVGATVRSLGARSGSRCNLIGGVSRLLRRLTGVCLS